MNDVTYRIGLEGNASLRFYCQRLRGVLLRSGIHRVKRSPLPEDVQIVRGLTLGDISVTELKEVLGDCILPASATFGKLTAAPDDRSIYLSIAQGSVNDAFAQINGLLDCYDIPSIRAEPHVPQLVVIEDVGAEHVGLILEILSEVPPFTEEVLCERLVVYQDNGASCIPVFDVLPERVAA